MIFIIPVLIVLSLTNLLLRSLFPRKTYFVGFGPLPINLNHAPAVRRIGGRAESFAIHTYSIGGEIDIRLFTGRKVFDFLIRFFCIPFIFSVFRYTHVVFYFDGGALGNGTLFIWRLEGFLYRLAGVKTILTAYGSDVHSTEKMINLELKHGYSLDYPDQWRRNSTINARIKYWAKNADFILAGCDWVDYLPRWDKLALSHFAIDIDMSSEPPNRQTERTFRILHAPNHPNLKGTESIKQAVETLKSEGLNLDLTLLSGVSNATVLEQIAMHELVIDQLVIGWYAQFAIEALAQGIPTVCHISQPYESLYAPIFQSSSLGLPFIQANTTNIEDVIRSCYINRNSLGELSHQGRLFINAFHSYEAIGKLFEEIIQEIKENN